MLTMEGGADQYITFEASDRSRSLPLALIHFLASELSLAPIREIAHKKCVYLNVSAITSRQPTIHFVDIR